MNARVLLCAGLALGCVPPTSYSERMQRCTTRLTKCQTIGEALEMEHLIGAALEAYIEGCFRREVAACESAIRLGNINARWEACKLGMLADCVDALAASPPTDPRRSVAIERLEQTSMREYAEVLGQLSSMQPPPERAVAYVCTTPPIDLESCAVTANHNWRNPAFAAKIAQLACTTGAAPACETAGERLAKLGDEAQARAHLRRGCELGHTPSCDRERIYLDRDRERAGWPERCRAGDQDACEKLGRDAASRGP